MSLPPYESPSFSGTLPATGVVYRRKSVGCALFTYTPAHSFLPLPSRGKERVPSVVPISYSHNGVCFSAQDRVLLYPPWAKGKRWENGEVSWGRKQSVFIVLPAAVTTSHSLHPLKAVEVHPVLGSTDSEPESMALPFRRASLHHPMVHYRGTWNTGPSLAWSH